MKKFFPLFFALIILASCEKDPDLDKVQDQVITYTQYDKNENFGTAKSFYVANQILQVDQSDKESYLPDATATQIINAFVAQMVARGYTQTTVKTDADLGIQMTYIESTYYFTVNNVGPYWWNSYPYYWGPGYWGPWTNWYYPYYNVFSFTNGSLLTDMVDLRATSTTTDSKLPVVWQAYTLGLLQGSTQQNIDNAITGIKQAFKQSSYIQAK